MYDNKQQKESLKCFNVFFENNKSLRTKQRSILEHHPSPYSKVNRPVAIACFLRMQETHLFVSSCYQLRTKEVTWPLSHFFITESFDQLKSIHFISAAYHLFDEAQQYCVNLLFLRVIELSETDLFEMVESVMKLVPIVDLHSFVCVGLEDLNVFVAELDDHRHMVILTIGDQSLQCTGCIFCLHQQNISRFSHLKQLRFQNSILFSIDILLQLPYSNFRTLFIFTNYKIDFFEPDLTLLYYFTAEDQTVALIFAFQREDLGTFIASRDRTSDSFEIEAADQMGPGFIFETQKFLVGEHTEASLCKREGTFHSFKKEFDFRQRNPALRIEFGFFSSRVVQTWETSLEMSLEVQRAEFSYQSLISEQRQWQFQSSTYDEEIQVKLYSFMLSRLYLSRKQCWEPFSLSLCCQAQKLQCLSIYTIPLQIHYNQQFLQRIQLINQNVSNCIVKLNTTSTSLHILYYVLTQVQRQGLQRRSHRRSIQWRSLRARLLLLLPAHRPTRPQSLQQMQKQPSSLLFHQLSEDVGRLRNNAKYLQLHEEAIAGHKVLNGQLSGSLRPNLHLYVININIF